jgi:bacillithiol biosynthesis cysteine-adding enzyme BshC
MDNTIGPRTRPVTKPRSFVASFLAGDPAARPFLPSDFRDPQVRLAHLRRAAQRAVCAPLLEELAAQQAALPPSASRRASLDALSRPGTAAVITGQQVGLFGGPLYSFYKAATAVAAARALEEQTGVRCVPIFWLQTEDHDFDEIASCHVLGADGAVHTMRVAADGQASPRTSVAHRRLGPDVEGALGAMAEALGTAPAAPEVMALLRAHYRPGVPLGRAFAGLMAEIFSEDGLLLFDPRNATVARLAAPLYRRAIEGQAEIGQTLSDRGGALRAAGLAEQVPTRPSCTLVFFHEERPTGPRYRLERRGGSGWAMAGGRGRVSDAELDRCLGEEPLRLSTSALLRPLVQDSLFPTAAYVGGPAEVGYFAQLGPLYQLFALPPPLVILRARFRCLDDKAVHLLAKMGLRAADLERPEPALARLVAETQGTAELPPPSALADELARALDPALARLGEVLRAADASLGDPAAATAATTRAALQRLVDKYALALARRDQVTARRLARLRTQLYPEETPQERFFSWPSLAARCGAAPLRRAMFAALAPFAGEIAEFCA